MKLTPEMIKQHEKDFSKAKSYEDLMGKNGVIKKLIKSSLENILEEELADHLGYDIHSLEGNNSGNSRNGKTHKTIKTDEGMIEDKIISMYAKGMTTRDIQSHFEDIYGLAVTATTISRITDSIIAHAKEWQSRPLAEIYPIVFFDAIHYKMAKFSQRLPTLV